MARVARTNEMIRTESRKTCVVALEANKMSDKIKEKKTEVDIKGRKSGEVKRE